MQATKPSGANADVLIVLQLPGGNGPVTAVSVPRDDYVDRQGARAAYARAKSGRPMAWRTSRHWTR